MADKIIFVAYYLNAIGFITQVALIVMQLRTYRRTGHSSLLFLTISASAGIIGLAMLLAPRVIGITSTSGLLFLYGASALFVTIQSILGVLGVLFLLRVFELALSKVNLENN